MPKKKENDRAQASGFSEVDQIHEGLQRIEVASDAPGAFLQLGKDGELAVTAFPLTDSRAKTVSSLVERALAEMDSSEVESIKSALKIAAIDLHFSVLGQRGKASQSASTLPIQFALSELYEQAYGVQINNARNGEPSSISLEGKFALTFLPCDSQEHSSVQESALEDLREQYKQIQAARAEIDAKREEWLHEKAEPLLDALEDQLLDASFPQEVREEIAALREQLRQDAYGYSKIIDTAQLQELLGLSATRARELSQDGRIGVAVSRFYVHSSDEASHFAQKERPTGKHRNK